MTSTSNELIYLSHCYPVGQEPLQPPLQCDPSQNNYACCCTCGKNCSLDQYANSSQQTSYVTCAIIDTQFCLSVMLWFRRQNKVDLPGSSLKMTDPSGKESALPLAQQTTCIQDEQRPLDYSQHALSSPTMLTALVPTNSRILLTIAIAITSA